ncbi:MAG: hypothetical protein EOO90_17090 [Pedobacter sp.]|nr:MAG: hypothetical protein EOO90_17090 [Pedobacter sp.]
MIIPEILIWTGLIIASVIMLLVLLIKNKQLKKSSTTKAHVPLYWHLLNDLYQQNTFAPWEELLVSKLADPNDIAPYLSNDTYVNYGEFDRLSGSRIPKEYKVDDLLFVHWRSSQQSWDHLAGREGYVVISKSKKRQIDFIMTIVS